MRYIYFENDNLNLLIDWLKAAPPSRYTLVIGSDTKLDKVDVLIQVTIQGGLNLAMELINKMAADEIRIFITDKVKVPPGLEL